MTGLCSPLFPVIIILASVIVLVGLLIRYRIQARRNKEAEFDWNLQLMTALSILAVISLAVYLAYTFIHFGRC